MSSKTPATRPVRVLVVDDDVWIRQLLRRLLGGRGFGVVDARSGEEAIALLEASPDLADVALIDVTLTGQLQGPHVAREVRTRAQCGIVYVSGRARSEVVLPDDAPHGDFVEKPFQIDRLLRAILAARPVPVAA